MISDELKISIESANKSANSDEKSANKSADNMTVLTKRQEQILTIMEEGRYNMQNQSQREKIRLQFLQRLRQDNNVRAVLPRDFYDNLKDEDIAELDDYILLAQHRRYLSNKKKMAQSETEKKQLLNEIFTTQQYMLIAKFGDKNIGRFTNI